MKIMIERALGNHLFFNFHNILIALLCVLITGPAPTHAEPNSTDLQEWAGRYGIIPVPQSIKQKSGIFEITRNTQLLINSDEAKGIADYFQKFIIPATGYKLEIQETNKPQNGAINLLIEEDFSSPEAYTLSVKPKRIIIRASNKAGLFYGVQSLRQMLPPEIESNYPINDVKWGIAAVKIKDRPLYSYRGMHLDVSRHFFPKDFIKRYIDFLALYKLNYFHWHLTDDQGWRIEIKKYPKLTSVGGWRPQTVIGHPYDRVHFYDGKPVGGFYTQEDIREIVKYAKERQVTIVPEIDVPGHTSALLAAYPQLGCIKKDYKVKTEFHIFRDVICPTEESFSFLEGVFAEVAELFPGPYIHIGGDEVMKDQWKACESCAALMKREGLESYEELQSYFVRRVEKTINGLGKKMAGWEEILEGGINPSATITTWLNPEQGIKAVRQGHDLIIGMSDKLYFNQFESLSFDEPMSSSWQPPIALRDIYEYDPMPGGLTEEQAQHVLGAQGHVWGNFIKTPEQVEYASLPRMSALSEILWSRESDRSWTSFLARLDNSFRRLDFMETNASRAVYKVSGKHKIVDGALKLDLMVEGERQVIRYTLDGSKPNAQSALYSASLVFTEPAIVRAVGQNKETGEMYGDFRLSVAPHKALGKSIKFLQAPRALYQPGPQKTILDGVMAYDRVFHPTEWAEFLDGDLDAVIDFGEETNFHSVGLGYEAGRYRRLFWPQSVEVLISNDSETWVSVAKVGEERIVQSSPFLNIEFEEARGRFLRVIGVNDREVYNTRLEKKAPVSIYIDELVVH